MTTSLVAALDLVRADDVSAVATHYRHSVLQCLLASVMANVAQIRDTQIRVEVIVALWTAMRRAVYAGCSAGNAVALHIAGYAHSVSYLGLAKKDAELIAQFGGVGSLAAKIASASQTGGWRRAAETAMGASMGRDERSDKFKDMASEYGWDSLSFFSSHFADRNLLLEQWYELECRAKNVMGMAAVSQLIKALNHQKFRAKKSQHRPDGFVAARDAQSELDLEQITLKQQENLKKTRRQSVQPSQSQSQTVEKNENGGDKEEEAGNLNSLRAQLLARQRQQNQQ